MRILLSLIVLFVTMPLASAAQPTPVVVELFTSEGCSSCPPADDVLRRLAEQQPIAGVEIIAIGEHVDYWDYLGWPDRFATAEFSELQRNYARTRRDGRVHTPQVVVNGQAMAVGRSESIVKTLVRRAAQQPLERLPVEIVSRDADALTVEVAVPESARGLVLRAMLVERGLSTAVRHGENAGKRLAHAPTARSVVSQRVGDAGVMRLTVPLPTSAPAFVADNGELVVLIQRQAGAVLAAGQVALVAGR